MKTLAVYYSKTGTTKAVAEAVVQKLGCDRDEIVYDEAAKAIQTGKDPAEYDKVILLSPVWALSLAEPMKLYLQKHGPAIKAYALIVTCGSLGLRGSVRACKKLTGKDAEQAVKLKSKQVRQGTYTLPV